VTIDQREFRNILGQFATGIAIVTATADGNRIGATISSFNSVSIDPPLVLFSMANKSLGLAQWKAAKAMAIFVLGEEQISLSNRFARAGGDKWAGLDDALTDNGSPALPGAIARFECLPYATYPGGDHEIFVCEVTGFGTADAKARPLIFHAGKYCNLKSIEDGQAPPEVNMWLHGW
jgi:flavin reductase (DIM6/NTAB) family NADH-FMN oxidoreductase RutF